MFFHPRWPLDPAAWLESLVSIAASTVLILLLSLRGKSRPPLAGWLLFIGTLFPVLGFLNVFPFVFSFVADHFQYLASLAIIVLASAGIATVIARLARPARYASIAVCIVAVGILAVLSP